MALPPWVPANQASRIAGTCSATQPIVSGRPFISTTTVGVPVAWTALTRSSWRPVRSSEVRDAGLAAHARRLARRRRSPPPPGAPAGRPRRCRRSSPPRPRTPWRRRPVIPDRLGGLGLDAGQEGHDVLRPAVAAPVAERGVRGRRRAGRGRRSTGGRGSQRQHAALVLEQHQRAPGDLAGGGECSRAAGRSALASLVGVGVVEQAEAELEPEDRAARPRRSAASGPCPRSTSRAPMARRRAGSPSPCRRRPAGPGGPPRPRRRPPRGRRVASTAL